MKKTKVYPADEYDPVDRREESYELDFQSHRIGAPAVYYYEDHVLVAEYFYVRGRAHRLEGPSTVLYGPDGDVLYTAYSVNGSELSDTDRFDYLSSLPAEEKLEAVVNSPFAVLLDEGAEPDGVIDALRVGVTSVDGVRQILAGAPPEWVRSFESAAS